MVDHVEFWLLVSGYSLRIQYYNIYKIIPGHVRFF